MASAQGIRLEKSKLRYHSQEFSLGEFSFVRGKEYWRMTGAGEVQVTSGKLQVRSEDRSDGAEKSQASLGAHKLRLREIIPRMALLLRRLLHGEEAHPELFDHIRDSLELIEDCEGVADGQSILSEDQSKTLESLIVFRIVHLLGYVGNDKEIDIRVISAPLCNELLDVASGQRVVMNKHINKALRESQL